MCNISQPKNSNKHYPNKQTRPLPTGRHDIGQFAYKLQAS